jgi:hypothetical protein
MGGFLEAEERYYNMNKRLEHYRRLSAPASLGSSSFSAPERVLEPVSGVLPKVKTVPPNTTTVHTNADKAVEKLPKKAFEKSAEKAAEKAAVRQAENHSDSLFGIKLTRDNCLIIALIIMLAKEKADVKLIIALVYLLL